MLQVWLPLNGNIKNQGLSNYTIDAVRGSIVYNDSGKIGKCFYAHGVNTLRINNIIPDFYNYSSYSLCAWFYIEAQNTTHSGSAVISAGNWNAQVLNLALGNWSTDHYTTLRISGTSWSRNYAYNFFANQWYHVVVSSDGTSTKAYVNGVLINDTAPGFLPTSIEGNDIYIGGASYYSGMQFFGRINDVRIYDHALSEKEVQEIAKGLVVHYKLDDKYAESTVILSSTISDTAYNASNGKYGYNTTSNLIKTSGIFQGKQCIKVSTREDGQTTRPYAYFSNLFTSNGTNAPQYKALSFDYFTNVSTVTKLNFYKLGNGSGTVTWKTINNNGTFTGTYTNSSQSIIIQQNVWNHIELIFKGTTDANAEWGYCVNGNAYTSNSDLYFLYANIQLEENDHVTGYKSEYHHNTIYDCSGYQNNATNVNCTISTDTAKYNVSIAQKSGQYIRSLGRPNNFLPHDAITVNLWMKCTTWGNPISCTESGGFNFEANGNYIYFPIHITHSSGTSYAGARTSITRASLLNDWHMITGVYDGTNTIIYVDGEESGRNTTKYSGVIHYQNNYLFIGAEAQGDNTTPADSSYTGNISDVRIYATALSAAAIKDLYETSAEIDKNGNFYAREIIEL